MKERELGDEGRQRGQGEDRESKREERVIEVTLQHMSQ